MGEPMTAATAGRGLFPSLDALEVVLWPTLAVAVFVFTAIAADLVVALAARWRMLHRPLRRSGHSLPSARGGGLVVICATSLATLLLAWRWPTDRPAILTGVLVPALAIAAIGRLADARPLPTYLRLALQAVVAAWITAILGPLDGVAWPGGAALRLGAMAWPVTVLWIVVSIEALAAVEDVDGLAALAAVIGGTVALATAWVSGSSVIVLLAAFVSAAAGGLLVFNWDPSRIGIGRAGSGFLGAMLAALPLALRPADERSAFVVPIALGLWPLIGDLLVSMPRRLGGPDAARGEVPGLLVERLTAAGVSHARTALVYGTLAAAGGFGGVWALGRPGAMEGRPLLPLGAVLASAVAAVVILQLRPLPSTVAVQSDEHVS